MEDDIKSDVWSNILYFFGVAGIVLDKWKYFNPDTKEMRAIHIP